MSKQMSRVLFVLLLSWNVFADESKPKYIPTTVRLSQKQDYIRKHPAPDFWAMMSYYVPQQDGAACGIASMTMLMNAARVHLPLTSNDALITQKVFVDKTKVKYNKGLTLDQLGESTRKALAEFGLKGTVEVIHADGSPAQNKKIREILIMNEKSDQNFILANFLQSVYTGDPEGPGHISPIGAFDAKTNSVLIFDVDREYYEPYWISFDAFIKGINTEDASVKKNRGLVFVQLVK